MEASASGAVHWMALEWSEVSVLNQRSQAPNQAGVSLTSGGTGSEGTENRNRKMAGTHRRRVFAGKRVVAGRWRPSLAGLARSVAGSDSRSIRWLGARGRGRLARATAEAIRHRGERGFFCRPERARKMTDY